MSDVELSRQKPPDGGWGWLIILAAFINAILAWIYSIFQFCFCMSSSVGIALARKLGHRTTVMIAGFVASCGVLSSAFATKLYHVYISYGIVTGSSLGLTYTVSIEMVSIYFERKLTIAIGIALAGVGAGQLTLSLFTQLLVENYGWRGALIILSAVGSHICVAGAFFRPLLNEVDVSLPSRNAESGDVMTINNNTCGDSNLHDGVQYCEVIIVEEKKQKSCLTSAQSFLKTVFGVVVFKNPLSIFLVFVSLGFGFSELVVVMNMVKRARDFGIGDTQSAFIPAMMGLVQLIGRPLLGVIGHTPCVKAHMLFGTAIAICGILAVVSSYIKSFAGQLFCIGGFGIGVGGFFVGLPLTISQFFGHENIGPGTSLMMQAGGVMSLASGPFVGWIRDTFGEYDIAFWASGIVSMLASAVVFTLPSIDRRLKRRHSSRRHDSKK
ncbi:monocarboxylate transporter 12-like isoform X3 [Ptychodera flava]|uniref:monocarboxylate transporter 12-like isoform X3 n=1 Tax=Ptychodera flava TaxID=63121 RepID=UPI003969D4DC